MSDSFTFYDFTGSAGLFLVVQNEGEKRVKVNINIQPPLDSSLEAIKLSKHQSEKVCSLLMYLLLTHPPPPQPKFFF